MNFGNKNTILFSTLVFSVLTRDRAQSVVEYRDLEKCMFPIIETYTEINGDFFLSRFN